MKISFMTFACPDWGVPEIVAAAQRCGCDGVEIRVAAKHRHGVELGMDAAGRRETLRRFRDAGVAVSCIATSLRFDLITPVARAESVEALRRYVELAADLSAPVIRVFGGPLPESLDLDTAVDYVATGLGAVAGDAGRAGVTIGLETHDSFHLGQTVGRTLRRVNSPAVRAIWDVQHPFLAGESLDDTLAHLSGRIAHTHFHDFVTTENGWRIVPLGEGLLPLDDVLARLKSIGFDGYLSGEWWPEMVGEPDVAIPAYVHGLRTRLLSS